MNRLVEELKSYCEGVVSGGKNDAQSAAEVFLSKGILPDGSKVQGGRPKFIVGFGGDVKIGVTRVSELRSGISVTFDMRLSPGKGGGAGVSISPVLSNQFFNMAGTDSNALKGMSVAFGNAIKKETGNIGAAIHEWLSNPENWIGNVVGFDVRKRWGRPKTKILSMSYGAPMIDPTRREWPSGRTEIWVPISLKVMADIGRK